MHSPRSDSSSAAQEAEDDRVPRRRLTAWTFVFGVIALGLVLYFMYHARVSPLFD